tara:strand:+ start:69 stop:776 length:708 start_codon:yes stop_codon:yes gene_type:complete
MATVNAGKYGTITGTTNANFNAARQGTASSVTNQSTSSNTIGSRAYRDTGRGGTNYRFYRFFCAFDVSAYSSGYTITGLTLNFRGTSNGGCSPTICLPTFITLESTAQGNADTDLVVGDFYSSVDYSSTYSSSFAWTDANGDVAVTLNSDAISAFSSGYVKLVVVENAHDYGDSAGSADWSNDGRIAYSGAGYVPYLDFTATPSGYGNDVIGVSSSNISEVISVATANINEIIGA